MADYAFAVLHVADAEVRPRRTARRPRHQSRIAILTRTERAYHRRRRQDAMDRLTPVAHETIMAPAATEAVQPNLSPVRAADPGLLH